MHDATIFCWNAFTGCEENLLDFILLVATCTNCKNLHEHLHFPREPSCINRAQDEKERELFAQIRKREDAEREVERALG